MPASPAVVLRERPLIWMSEGPQGSGVSATVMRRVYAVLEPVRYAG